MLNKTVSSSRTAVIMTLIRGVLLGLLLGGVFMAGFLVRGAIPSRAASIVDPNATAVTDEVGKYPLLTEVQSLLNDHFLRPQPTQRQLEYSAIRGLVASLNDKYTFFVDPPVAASESNVLAGQYGGIGVQIKRDDAGHFVLYPFRDAPAAKAGVQDGDILLQVSGKDVPTSTQQDAVDQMLRGEVKSTNGVDNGVTIRIQRADLGSQKDFTVPFAVIDVPSVVWRTLAEAPTYGYIQILRFTNRTPDELKQAISELRAKNITALVLDLRDNPGGLLQESITVAGQFLDGGVVLYERSKAGETVFPAPKGGQMLDLPMVALINNGTASAAELVAGALKDRGRALVVGQTTYGKGLIQYIFALADNSSLHVTTAEWLPPSRTPLDGKGIAPQIVVTHDPNGRDLELAQAITALKRGAANPANLTVATLEATLESTLQATAQATSGGK